MAEKTKTLKVKQIATGDDTCTLFALCDDGSVWRFVEDSDVESGEWSELPAIEVVEEAGESEDD